MGIATKDQPCLPGQQIRPRPGVGAVRVTANRERQPNIQVRKKRSHADSHPPETRGQASPNLE